MRKLLLLVTALVAVTNANARKWIPVPSRELDDSIMKMEMQTYPLPEKSHVSYVIYDDLGFDIEFLEYDGHKYYDLAKKDKNGKVIMRNKKVVTEPTLAHCFILHGIREKGVKYRYNGSEHVAMSFILDEPSDEMTVAVWGNISPNKIGENEPDGRFTIPFYIGDSWTLGNKTKKFPKHIRAVKFNGLAIDNKTTYASTNNYNETHVVTTFDIKYKKIPGGGGGISRSSDPYVVIDIPDDSYFYDRPNVKLKNKYTLNHDSLPQKNTDSYIPPRFTGGADSLERFLDRNVNKSAYLGCLQTYQKFDITLTVTKTGEVKDVKLTGSIEKPLDKHIENALLKTNWIPGAIQLSFSKEAIDWTILIKDVQIFINWDEENIAKMASRPRLKIGDLYAVKTPTPLYTAPDKSAATIRIQDGMGGSLPYELDYGRIVKVLESHGNFVKIHWDGSMNYIERNGIKETVNEGYIPASCLTVPEPLPEEWYYEEYESPDGYEISFEIGDDTVTSSGTTVEFDKEHNIIVIGYMYTICYLNGEPQVRTRDIHEPPINQ